MKKIYTIKIYIEYEDEYININNLGNFNNELDAIKIGLNKIKEIIFKKNIDIDIIEYEFSITETLSNIRYGTYEELIKIYNENISKKLSKEELYDLLLYISKGKKSYYDYNGNLICIEKLNSDHFNSFSFKSLLGYHTNKFIIGDKVKFKYANDQCTGIIVSKYNQDNKKIYDSKDPYHFKEGYIVEYNINNSTFYNENWQEPYYDEDLEIIY